jgi:hemolysin activation/secretion protein
MNMKGMMGLYLMAAMMSDGQRKEEWQPQARPKPQPKKPQPKKQIIPKGLKCFDIDGIEVWAINEKNARRKLKK